MLDGIFNNSTKIYFGRTSLNYLIEAIREVNSNKNILLVYGKNSIKQNGIYDLITKQLNENFLPFIELNNIQSNPTMDKVEEGLKLCRNNKIEFILAVGGGSVIDTAKIIIKKVQSFLYISKNIKLGVVLTIPGAGSESNASAVITDVERQEKIGYTDECMRPVFAIMNPEYTMSLSLQQTACGILDAITHVLERYFTKTEYVKCTTEFCTALLKTFMFYYDELENNLNNYDIRAEIMYACNQAHNNVVGFGRKQDWASHAIAHEIGVYYPEISHGNLVFIIMLAWAQYLKENSPTCFINKYLQKYNLFTNLHEIDSNMNFKFEEIAGKCCSRTQSGTVGNYVRLTQIDIVNILGIAYRGAYI